MPNETLLTAQPRLAFLAAPTPEAQAAREALVALHGDVPPAEADVLVALGGDGLMLQTLHRHATLCKPVYGMKLGTVGFLMNHQRMESLVERLHAAEPAVLRPLEMIVQSESGDLHSMIDRTCASKPSHPASTIRSTSSKWSVPP